MKLSGWISGVKDRVSRFEADQAGAVTMEFVILLPLLVIWGVGSFLYYDAYRSLALTNKVGFTIADIASRYEEVTKEDIQDLHSLAVRMLPPRDFDYRLRISSICYDETPTAGGDPLYRVRWSDVENPGVQKDDLGLPLLDDFGLPIPVLFERDDDNFPTDMLPLMGDHDTVLYVELYSTWRPLSTKLMAVTEKTWFVDLVIRPRFVQSIPFVDTDDSGNIVYDAEGEPVATQTDCEPEDAAGT